jgi:class 3 adenylate cyclase
MAMTFVTVKLGGGLIGGEIRRQTIADIGSTAMNYQVAQEDVARSLAQINSVLAQAPKVKAAAGVDDAATLVEVVARQMEDTQAEAYLWLHESGKLAACLQRHGEGGTAYLGKLDKPASDDLFAFGEQQETAPAAVATEELERVLRSLKRRWRVEEMKSVLEQEVFVQYLMKFQTRTRGVMQASGTPDVSGQKAMVEDFVIAPWRGHLYLFAFRPLIYRGGGYEGVLAAGFEMGDAFASRISTLTGSELTFLLLPEEGEARIVGFGTTPKQDQGRARKRGEYFAALIGQGKLKLGETPITESFQGEQWVVQAAALKAVSGADQAVRLIAGNLSARLGILTHLQNTLLGVSGGAAVLALLLISLGMGYWVNGPVERLSRGMKRIQSGDLEEPLKVESRDEMGELAEAYNQMLVELQKKEQYMRMVSKSAVKAVETSVSANLEGGGERRVVTVLFSDIRGFTTLCERIDPNKLVSILNRYFDSMVEIIYRHGGLLDKFIGDAVMAIFEGPESAQDSVLAALEMMQEVARLDREEGLGLKIGVGLHTGEVIAGFVGAKEFMNHTYLGDAVNTSARLEGVSKNGKHTMVILSQATLDRVPGLIDVEKLELDHVKGKTEAVTMYEIIRLRERQEMFSDLSAEDPEVRRRAATMVGRLGGREGISQLLGLVAEDEELVAITAMKALRLSCEARSASREILPVLLKRAEGGSAAVRAAVVRTLGVVGGFPDLPHLTSFLEDEDSRVRADAIEALETLEAAGTRELVAPLLSDGNGRVRANAAMLLFDRDPEEVCRSLIEGLHSLDPGLRASSCRAVTTLAERSPRELLRTELAKGLDSRDYLRHTCLRRLAAVLSGMVGEETEVLVLRNLVPGLRLFLGSETTRQLFVESYRGDDREELLQQGDEVS